MADALKMLVTTNANRNPATATETTVYTVPGSTTAMLSRIIVANRLAVPNSFRISLVPVGGGIAAQNYVAFDVPIGANDTINFALGVGLGAGDFISVYATTLGITFTPCGIEVT